MSDKHPYTPSNSPETLTFTGVRGAATHVLGETAVSRALLVAAGLADEAAPVLSYYPEHHNEHTALMDLAQIGAEKLKRPLEVHSVGEHGYLLQLGKGLDPTKSLHLTDFDDTAGATMAAKGHLAEDYQTILTNLELKLNENEVSQILKAADKFARWQEDGHPIHHLDAHYLALSWATETLKLMRGFAAGDVAVHVVDTLNTLTPLEKGQKVSAGPDFDRHGNKLTTGSSQALITPEMTKLFMRFVRLDAVEAVVDVYREQQQSGAANTGIFSYGVPQQQLTKILTMLLDDQKARGDAAWQPDIVLLTKVAKGNFLQVLADHSQDKTKLGAVVQTMLSCPQISMLDDDPAQLDSLKAANSRMRLIRSIQEGTKTVERAPNWAGGEVADLRKSPEALRAILGAIAL